MAQTVSPAPAAPTAPVATPIQQGTRAVPSVEAINANLAPAADPLAFIKVNLKTPVTNQPQVSSNQVLEQPAVPQAPMPPVIDSVLQSSFADRATSSTLPLEVKDLLQPIADQIQDRTDQLTQSQEDQQQGDPNNKDTTQQNFRNLRRKANDLQAQVTERDTNIAQLQEQIQKYESGELLPDVVKQKDDKIEELRYFESLHNFKTSPDYQREYVEPYENLKAKLLQTAKDYNVSNDTLNEALGIDSKKELNAFLRTHFDEVEALDVRDTILKMREINDAAIDAEKKPQETLDHIRAEFQNAQRVQNEMRQTTMVTNSKSGWSEALTDLTKTGEYPELTIRENDAEHNKVVRPILEEAGKEYGAMIRVLSSFGLRELPPDVAKILAKRFQLSQIAPIAALSRADHYNTAQRVTADARRQAPLLRPNIGGSSPVSAPGGAPAPNGPASVRSRSPQTSLSQAADSLIGKVLDRRIP